MSSTPETNWDRPCPTCKAQPGQPCRRPNGDRRLTPYGAPRWHAKRVTDTTTADAMTVRGVRHECDGRLCDLPITVRRSVRLGCGCTRHEGDRHDGTGIHLLSGGCSFHNPDFEAARQ